MSVTETEYDVLFDVWNSSKAVWFEITRRDGRSCTHRLTFEHAARIGDVARDTVLADQEWDGSVPEKPHARHNFCPECGTRCQFCPECGERLR